MKLKGMDVLSQYWELAAKVLPHNLGSILVMFKTVTRYGSVMRDFLPNA